MRRLLLGLAVLILCGPVTLRAADELSEIKLNDYAWQALPAGVSYPRVGPDERTWYQDSRAYPPFDLGQLQEHLAGQFEKPAPAVQEARVILFEPTGRVWFQALRLRTLLGYDGKEWITKTLEADDRFVSSGPTRGSLINANVSCFAGGAAWFKGSRGVYRFDGKKWDRQSIPIATPQDSMLLCVHPEGKTAAAHPRNTGDLWIFHDGAWNKQQGVLGTDVHPIEHMALESPQSLLYVGKDRQLGRLRIEKDGTVAREPSSGRLGSAEVSGVHALCYDQEGTLYVAAEAISEADSAPAAGVLIHEPGGKTRILKGKALLAAFNARDHSSPMPILTPDKKQLWLPHTVGAGRAHLFDLERNRIVAELPADGFHKLEAVDKAGRVFVSGGFAGFHKLSMVFTSGGKEYPTLKAEAKELQFGSPRAISDDGSIWAVEKTGHVVCWDDGDWKRIRPEPFTGVLGMTAGDGGMLLLHADGTTMLCEKSSILAEGAFIELLEQEQERIKKHFGRSMPATPTSMTEMLPAYQVAAGSNGIWCLSGGSLRLFANDRWYDATDALIAAGSRGGGAGFVALVGDDKVYVSDLKLRHDGGKSFFGDLMDSKLKFTEAPHALRGQAKFFALPAGRDSVWITATEGRATGSSDTTSGQRAIRINKEGIAEDHKDIGQPALVDRSCLWLTSVWGKPPDLVHRWRDGKLLQELHIPSFTGGLLCSDDDGSVYALTAIGLQRLVADQAEKDQYRLGEQYAIEGLSCRTTSEGYSRQGYIVVATHSQIGLPAHWLHLIKLPIR